jgi:pyruvate-formate lyase-activating enzyme
MLSRLPVGTKRFLRRAYHSDRLRKAARLPKSKAHEAVRIEITGSCNASCTYCHSGPLAFAKNKFISPADFERTLKQFIALNVVMSNGITLYDRGEPFLHRQLGALLDILDRYELKALISTNASRVPKLTAKQWAVIKDIKFSICGITPETYKRIYGFNVDLIKKNIEIIARKADFRTALRINWLRYTFNRHEEKEARAWAAAHGIGFHAKNADVSQIDKLVGLVEKTLPKTEVEAMQNDLLPSKYFPKHLCDDGARLNPLPEEVVSTVTCSQWRQINVDERGRLKLCCGLSPADPQNICGDIFSMNTIDDVIAAKRPKSDICTKCIAYGFVSTKTIAAPWKSVDRQG